METFKDYALAFLIGTISLWAVIATILWEKAKGDSTLAKSKNNALEVKCEVLRAEKEAALQTAEQHRKSISELMGKLRPS
jgi:hypothetical protein